MPKITVCMIVKDEARSILQVIESTRALDPEYVVVDTGSTDGTQDLLRSVGIEPIPYLWEDDYAKARNFALQHATGDWVLSIDGDELLSNGWDWKDLIERHPYADCFSIEKRSYVNDDLLLGYRGCRGEYPEQEAQFKGYLSEPNDLLFRNLRGITWKGAVHETIGQSLVSLGKCSVQAPSPYVIHNYGRHANDPDKSRDYMEKAIKRLSQDAQDPVSWYYVGLSHMENGLLAEAEEHLQRSLSLAPTMYALFYLARVQLSLGKLSLAEQGFVSFLRSRPKEFPAWAGLFTTVLKREDQERLDYYVSWAVKAGMGTRDIYKLAAHVSNKLENFGKGRQYHGKAEELQRVPGPNPVPAGNDQSGKGAGGEQIPG